MKATSWMLGATVVAIIAFAIAPQPRPANGEFESASDFAYLAQGKIRTILRDPDSATFSPWVGLRASRGALAGQIACGMVNAKNGFGGYVGRKLYVYAATSDGKTLACSEDYMPKECVSLTETAFYKTCINVMRRSAQ